MVKNEYTPSRGDFAWFDFDPTLGHEQARRRPALVLSAKGYNKKSSLVVVCPITKHAKGYPFEVVVNTKEVSGVVLVDQIRAIDWEKRRMSFIGNLGGIEFEIVQRKAIELIVGEI